LPLLLHGSRWRLRVFKRLGGSGEGLAAQILPAGFGRACFDLAPSAARAIAWLSSLEARSFVGTESRLRTLFDLLRHMAERADDDLTETFGVEIEVVPEAKEAPAPAPRQQSREENCRPPSHSRAKIAGGSGDGALEEARRPPRRLPATNFVRGAVASRFGPESARNPDVA
jgi:hypothetical protein